MGYKQEADILRNWSQSWGGTDESGGSCERLWNRLTFFRCYIFLGQEKNRQKFRSPVGMQVAHDSCDRDSWGAKICLSLRCNRLRAEEKLWRCHLRLCHNLDVISVKWCELIQNGKKLLGPAIHPSLLRLPPYQAPATTRLQRYPRSSKSLSSNVAI